MASALSSDAQLRDGDQAQATASVSTFYPLASCRSYFWRTQLHSGPAKHKNQTSYEPSPSEVDYDLMVSQPLVKEALTKFAADNMELCQRSDPEELVEAFLDHLRKTGHLL